MRHVLFAPRGQAFLKHKGGYKHIYDDDDDDNDDDDDGCLKMELQWQDNAAAWRQHDGRMTVVKSQTIAPLRIALQAIAHILLHFL